MSFGLAALILCALLVLLLVLGSPVAFAFASAAIIIILIQEGPNALFILTASTYESWMNYVLVSIPLFVMMAAFLERSGIADDLYEAMYKWLGRMKGGLAIGTIIICAIFAAMAGVSSVGTITMGMIALPSMLKRKYDKILAIGSVSAGGTLGILIPPSIPMIFYGFLAQESIGALFMGGVVPGILMALLFIVYITIRCYLQPTMGPPVPFEERFTFRQKIVSIKSLILPVLLIIIVLGSIYTGVTTTTESAGIGALGALLCMIIYKKFSIPNVKGALKAMLRITAMVGWMLIGANLFNHVYQSLGAQEFVSNIINSMGLSGLGFIILTQVILLILGCFMDPVGIMILTIPIFVPIVKSLGFSNIWFGILFTINMEMAYITPPFGLNLFFMQSIVPKGITIIDIYKSIVPFVVVMLIALALVISFPELALWLPGMMKLGS